MLLEEYEKGIRYVYYITPEGDSIPAHIVGVRAVNTGSGRKVLIKGDFLNGRKKRWVLLRKLVPQEEVA